MALMCRRKAFCLISRYRLCGRFSSSTAIPSPAPLPPSLPQMPARKQLLPAMAMHSSLAAPPFSAYKCAATTSVIARNFTVPAFITSKGTTKDTPCCVTHKCTSRCGCSCMITSGFLSSARNCSTSAYPPPTPPGEFQGGDEDDDVDGAPLNVDEAAAEEGALPPEDLEMPPFDDANDAEDDGDYVDEDPPPDPEEALLFSPSDSD